MYVIYERQVPEIKVNDEPIEAESGPHKRMRTKLRWFFMSTCDKYRANRTWPTKLLLQLLKVLLVTIQVCIKHPNQGPTRHNTGVHTNILIKVLLVTIQVCLKHPNQGPQYRCAYKHHNQGPTNHNTGVHKTS